MSGKVSRPYENVRCLLEKQVVVLDIGAAYTKFGYAGEATPRGITKTEIKCTETKKIRPIFKYNSVDDLYQLLVEFLHAIFFKHVVITPKDKKLVVLESLLTPTKFRDTLAKVLFKHFEIASLMLLPSHLVTISTLGWDTALVLDVGYQDATLIPVYKGVPVLKAWQSLPLAAEAVHNRMLELFRESVPEVDFNEELIEDIKVRTCFVTSIERSRKLESQEPPVPPPSVKYPGLMTITIPGHIREKAFELLWERDNDNLSIPTMILDSLVKCPIDMRQQLAENILLVGGTVMTKGFTARLKSELISIASSNLYCEKLKSRNFKFHTPPCKPNYTVWLGGAIFGIADLPSRCILKENYLKDDRVPDWASLLYNKKEGSSSGI
ncbi:actin-related protein 10 [Fopius arisanus]|uniref:Actin-related protein 10 n=1 Tax=Fopius arisanus TaxID=64838 RepID=A0A0C9RUG0_9HYME|nr:PREDICTED: actin-related protein 10 [Fopius arisanus]